MKTADPPGSGRCFVVVSTVLIKGAARRGE